MNPRARGYMAEGRFVALSGSRKSKFVKQHASKPRESIVSWESVLDGRFRSLPLDALPMK